MMPGDNSPNVDQLEARPSQERSDVLSLSATRKSRSRPDASPGQLSELIHSISNQEAKARYKTEEADNRIPVEDGTDSNSLQGVGQKTIIAWEPGDKANPYNWSERRKALVLLTSMAQVMNSTMGSSLPSMAIPYIAKEFGVTSELQLVLPISTYLIGYVFGPILWGPMSEHIGRRDLSIATFLMFILWTMSCALAPNWPSLLIFRLFCGVFASAPIAVVTGILADIYNDPVQRGRAMAYFMVTTMGGPLAAPIISGFCSTSIGWRWTFWIGLIFAGATLVLVIILPETYAPVLLTRRAAKIRKADPKAQVYSSSELEGHDYKQLVTRVLTRPIRMLLTELIVATTCLYLALVYSIFYMSFEAFPIIFQDVYDLSPGVAGLCYLPIGGGGILALPIFFGFDRVFRIAKEQGRPWSKKEEYRRVPLATIGGPMFVISMFWLGWTARPEVPFVVPMLAGLLFGGGFLLIFMGMLNYLTDAYEIFAASANAAASSARSTFAVVLPLATTPMFARLGINGACSLLGGLSLVLSIVPFIFLWKGERIRAGSKFCIALKERKLEMEQRAEKEEQRQAEVGRAAKDKEQTV
ncbi:major facilitator superfamily transporter [Xylariaceae sp. FL0016]|nr:major facilitator superfamily transporter [Xylariaceae sp. FL0016]